MKQSQYFGILAGIYTSTSMAVNTLSSERNLYGFAIFFFALVYTTLYLITVLKEE